MSPSQVISLLSGVALFLFGMSLMGDGLKKVSGSRLEPILYRLSDTTLKGVALGTGITAVIQSSAATSVMTVGFVNSGMMKTRQAVGVILGAILGTSITGWVICLSYIPNTGGLTELISTSTLTGAVAIIGIYFRMFSKKPMSNHLGDILMGFAVLMFGMSTMSGSVSDLGKQEWFIAALTTLSNPLLGILVGALFTALLQSASAAVGIVQALSVTGAMGFGEALPLLMGITIGASAPILFSAIGANVGGRRTAMIYPVATCAGVLVTASVFYLLNAFLSFGFLSATMDPFSMAAVNTFLRLAIVVVLLPFTDVLEAAVKAMIKDDPVKPNPAARRLEERFIAHPALAIEGCRLTINEMAELSEQAIDNSFTLFSGYSQEGFDGVKKLENDVDAYEDALGTYLIKLTGQDLTQGQNEEATEFMHVLTDFERISDHALNLAGNAQELHEKGVHLSETAIHELDVLTAAVSQVVSMTVTAFRERDLALARRVEPLEELIDDLTERMKLNHVERLQKGICTITQGFVFNDIVTNCERVSDHCSNVAVAMIELSDDEFKTHKYMHSLQKETPEFKAAYEEYASRFAI